jgi:hypothetical protein
MVETGFNATSCSFSQTLHKLTLVVNQSYSLFEISRWSRHSECLSNTTDRHTQLGSTSALTASVPRLSQATTRQSSTSRMRPPDQTTDRCRLLELPGELRNMVYQNVLTHPLGLISTPDEPALGFIPHSGTARGARGQDPNPLRYVCRQLHYETRHLLLKHNSCVLKGKREAV